MSYIEFSGAVINTRLALCPELVVSLINETYVWDACASFREVSIKINLLLYGFQYNHIKFAESSEDYVELR